MAERLYAKALIWLAKQIDRIIRDIDPQDPDSAVELQRVLGRYSHAIEPWARAVGARTLAEIDRRDATAWKRYSEQMGLALHQEINAAPTGLLMRRLLDEQVELITSLPTQAARRVQALVLGNLTGGQRSASVVEEIMRTGEVTRNRAIMIARTETARCATTLTQARAMSVGSEAYHWFSAHDSQVRPDHKRLDGHVFQWNDPPIADQRTKSRYHAGMGINCRCIPLPILPPA